MQSFDFQPTLKGERYSLRPFTEADFSDLFSVAGDKLLWAGHPSKNRYEEQEFIKWFESALASEQALIILDEVNQSIIGSTRFYIAPNTPNDISIGYTFLSRQYWGGDANYSVKGVMIMYAAEWFDTIWFHIAPSNIRSQKATKKIGAIFYREELIDLGGGAEKWSCYKLDVGDFQGNIAVADEWIALIFVA